MKVHLLGADAWAPLFQARGEEVSCAEPAPLDADLYVFGGGHEAMRHLAQGLVLLDLRNDPDLASAAWTAYADLCLVAGDKARAALVEATGNEPERIFVVADGPALLNLVDQALRDELPPAAVEKRGVPMPDKAPPALSDLAALAARLDTLERQADVMHRDYQVRSRLPLVAWVRRTLTSHLREPYLDPTLERQVRLNRDLITILRELVRRQAALEARLGNEERNSEG